MNQMNIRDLVISSAILSWSHKAQSKPLILLGRDSSIKLAMILAMFKKSERFMISSTDVDRRDILNYIITSKFSTNNSNNSNNSENKVIIVDDRVDGTERSYEVFLNFASETSIPVIIIPSEYAQMRLKDPNNFMFYKCSEVGIEWDWYKWITEMEREGLIEKN